VSSKAASIPSQWTFERPSFSVWISLSTGPVTVAACTPGTALRVLVTKPVVAGTARNLGDVTILCGDVELGGLVLDLDDEAIHRDFGRVAPAIWTCNG